MVFKFNKPLDSASSIQESSYPLPLKIIRLWFLIVSLINACNVVSKSSLDSRISANFSSSSAITAFNTMLHPAILELDPGILNSNLFPVNANGEVRLRSVESLGNFGRTVAPIFINSFSFPSYGLSSSIAFNTAVNSSPKKIEMIAGGASLAPSLWSFPAVATLNRNKSWCSSTALIIAARNTKNCAFSCGVSPGSNKFNPVSVDNDQLLCLPLPLIPSNGFS